MLMLCTSCSGTLAAGEEPNCACAVCIIIFFKNNLLTEERAEEQRNKNFNDVEAVAAQKL